LPHERRALQRFLPGGPLAFLPLADGRCSIVWSTANAHAEALLSLTDDEFRESLDDASDHALGAITSATARIAFPLKLMHAQSYVKPGLALVGDAAHVVHPLAGQGMNLGLADVQALAEVLAQARAERKALGSLRLLRRYERRRKSANLEVLALTEGLHRLFAADFPGLQGLREWGLRLVDRAGPLKRGLAERAMGI
jgi:2-octaprenylphenol hydroxylase